jgi:hypothetical protein
VDCLQAQSLISEAIDRQPVDAATLAQAKEHCRTCPECGAFVRAQLMARQAPLPVPPAGLTDRVMATIRAEAEATRLEAEAQAAQTDEAKASGVAAGEAASVAPAPKPEVPVVSLAPPKPRTRRKLPRPLVVGALAAAMLVALVGTGALVVFGTRQMNSSKTGGAASGSLATSARTQGEASTFDYHPSVAPQDGSTYGGASSAAPAAPAAGASKSTAGSESTGPKDITVNGVVYGRTGPATVSQGTLHIVGATTSAMGDGKVAIRRDVYAGLSPDLVYVADDAGALFEFARATRTYAGLTYVLTANELSDYSQWPDLPLQLTKPTSADGGPTFTYDGTDANGVKVYRLTTSRATEGIAVAPRTDQSGLGAGNPNWTWWAISR